MASERKLVQGEHTRAHGPAALELKSTRQAMMIQVGVGHGCTLN